MSGVHRDEHFSTSSFHSLSLDTFRLLPPLEGCPSPSTKWSALRSRFFRGVFPSLFNRDRQFSIKLRQNHNVDMVRLKTRYLLVNILYPGLDNKPSDPKIPDVVVFNQPTTDSLATQALVKGIKAEVSNLFGDHGAGATAESISS